jgi:hypothetical protein
MMFLHVSKTGVNVLKVYNLLAALMLLSCASLNEQNNSSREGTDVDIIMCKDPRPVICTREYDPVCAKLDDGSIKTYATGCTACADPRVIGYNKGECLTIGK